MNPMSDDELDREWKPNGRRPQSTIARSFSQELMDIFRIENSVADLDEQVAKRKQTVTTHQTELEALEARIREMEQRLGKPAGAPAPGQQQPMSPRSQRPAESGAFGQDSKSTSAGGSGSASAQKDQKHSSGRPGSARQQNQQAVPGAAPPTPVASEGEYEIVHLQQLHPSSMNSSYQSLHRSTMHESQSQSPTSNRSLHLRPGGATAAGGSDDARSVKSERSFADYVVVPAQDGDGEQDS